MQPLIASLAAEQQRHKAERENLHDEADSGNFSPAQILAYMEQRLSLIEESIERQRDAAAAYLDRRQMAAYNDMLNRDLRRARAELESWRASGSVAASANETADHQIPPRQ